MKRMYYYLYNMKTKELKMFECEIEESNFLNVYYFTTVSNGKKQRFKKRINDISVFEADRSGLYISACSFSANKMDEFKKMCIEQLIQYKVKCEEQIKSLMGTIADCDDCIMKLN